MKKISKSIAVVLTVIILAVQAGTALAGQTWIGDANAQSVCVETTATIAVDFTNGEAARSGNAMKVVARDLQSGASISLGVAQPGETVRGVIDTGLSELHADWVIFDVTWADGRSGKDSFRAFYYALDCSPTPATPTPTPTATATATGTPPPAETVPPFPTEESTPEPEPEPEKGSSPGVTCTKAELVGPNHLFVAGTPNKPFRVFWVSGDKKVFVIADKTDAFGKAEVLVNAQRWSYGTLVVEYAGAYFDACRVPLGSSAPGGGPPNLFFPLLLGVVGILVLAGLGTLASRKGCLPRFLRR